MEKLEFGFCLPKSGELAGPTELGELAQYAEKKGFDILAEPSDHIVVPDSIQSRYPYSKSGEYTDSKEDIEQLTAMSFVAGKTSQAKILSAITVIPYRNPLLLTKVLATIDLLSNGRLILGVGTGWMREEFEILRVDYPQRGEITSEYIQIIRSLWSNAETDFQGKHFSFPRASLLPRPVQKRLPIWIGGESKRAIERAVDYGDAWLPLCSNPTTPIRTPGEMKEALKYLRTYSIRKNRKLELKVGYMGEDLKLESRTTSSSGPFIGSSAEIAATILGFHEVGVSFIGFNLLGISVDESKENIDNFFSEVVPSVFRK